MTHKECLHLHFLPHNPTNILHNFLIFFHNLLDATTNNCQLQNNSQSSTHKNPKKWSSTSLLDLLLTTTANSTTHFPLPTKTSSSPSPPLTPQTKTCHPTRQTLALESATGLSLSFDLEAALTRRTTVLGEICGPNNLWTKTTIGRKTRSSAECLGLPIEKPQTQTWCSTSVPSKETPHKHQAKEESWL